mmetsp:Transcript_36464/g.85414  ORF Transcript_36464/g.85414 Transcript_36464/m.85414 type:complete len:307 (-) Transcript_36464:414-1334(-)
MADRVKSTPRMLLSRFSMSRRLTRERLMSVDDADRPEANKLEFDDEDLEKSWRREGMLLNMKLGCQQLLFINLLWMAWASWMLSAISSKRTSSPDKKKAFRIDVVFLIVNTAGNFFCLRRPSETLYFCLISTWVVFAMWHGIQPWSHSCEELIELCSKRCQDHSSIKLVTSNKDCTMQGHTTVDIIMAVLLLSPRLVPSARMMLFNWAYIIVYAVISFGYSAPWVESEKRPLSYHKTDMLVTVGILCFVSLVADRRKFFIEKGQRSKFFFRPGAAGVQQEDLLHLVRDGSRTCHPADAQEPGRDRR